MFSSEYSLIHIIIVYITHVKIYYSIDICAAARQPFQLNLINTIIWGRIKERLISREGRYSSVGMMLQSRPEFSSVYPDQRIYY